jgi:hypothetical protein
MGKQATGTCSHAAAHSISARNRSQAIVERHRALTEQLVEGNTAEVIARRLIASAKRVSLKATRLVLERTEGKAREHMDVDVGLKPMSVPDIEERIKELLSKRAGGPES